VQKNKTVKTPSMIYWPVMKREKTIRILLKSINGSIQTLTELDRDPPIIDIAYVTRTIDPADDPAGTEVKRVLSLATKLNDYKREYWKLELLIKQGFIDRLKKTSYLPGRSIEVESLRNELPNSLIKGDDRIWKFSYDHYLPRIAGLVGRKVEKAPGSNEIWDGLERSYKKKIDGLISRANDLLPELFHMRSLLKHSLKNPEFNIETSKLKKVKVTRIERPIKKVLVIKRPIPLPKKGKTPKKRVLRKPEVKVIGPDSK